MCLEFCFRILAVILVSEFLSLLFSNQHWLDMSSSVEMRENRKCVVVARWSA